MQHYGDIEGLLGVDSWCLGCVLDHSRLLTGDIIMTVKRIMRTRTALTDDMDVESPCGDATLLGAGHVEEGVRRE